MEQVYLLREQGTNYVKVGKTNDFKSRNGELNCGNPRKLTQIGFNEYLTSTAKNLAETRIQTELEELGLKTDLGGGVEWFIFDSNNPRHIQIYRNKFENLIDENNKKLYETKPKSYIERSNLFGETEFFLPEHLQPYCYFYPNKKAQILKSYEDTFKMFSKTGLVDYRFWRTMNYPTEGKQLLIDPKGNLISELKNKVFICSRKWNEIRAENTFNREKNVYHNTLEPFLS